LWFNQFKSVQLKVQSSSIRLGFKQDQTNQTTGQLLVQLVDLTLRFDFLTFDIMLKGYISATQKKKKKIKTKGYISEKKRKTSAFLFEFKFDVRPIMFPS
jgi:hypothetical protein